LKNIRENHCFLQGTVHFSLLLKIECYPDRVDIGIVAVIDYHAVTFPLTQIQPHSNRFQQHHPGGEILRGDVQIESNRQAVDGILNGCLIGEGNNKGVVEVQKRVVYLCVLILFLNVGDEEVGIPVLSGPGEGFLRKHHQIDATGDQIIVLIEDENITIGE